VAAFAVLAGGAGPGRADIIFDNFEPGDKYITESGRAVGFASPIGVFEVATAFTVAGGSFTLDQITLAVSLQGGLNLLDVAIAASDGGLPGAVLETFHFDGAMGPLGSDNPPLVAGSVLHPLLTEGSQYWVIASASGATTAVWNFNSTGGTGPTATREDGGVWSLDDVQPLQGALRVSGTPAAGPDPPAVPGPSSLALLVAGAVSLCARGRARRGRHPGDPRNAAGSAGPTAGPVRSG
jgi:hypothetical protein